VDTGRSGGSLGRAGCGAARTDSNHTHEPGGAQEGQAGMGDDGGLMQMADMDHEERLVVLVEAVANRIDDMLLEL